DQERIGVGRSSLMDPVLQNIASSGKSRPHCLNRYPHPEFGSGRGDDLSDPHRRVRLPMTFSPPHVLAPPELLDDDLLGAELVDDLGDHAGSPHGRGADRRPVRAGDEEDLVKDELAPGLALTPIDDDAIALADSELM